MILYKYVNYDVGLRILENNSIAFSSPNNFNDPFELAASYPSVRSENYAVPQLEMMRRDLKKEVWAKNTGILSLTRSPLNPLMWAHYGEEHTGFVIGLDVSI